MLIILFRDDFFLFNNLTICIVFVILNKNTSGYFVLLVKKKLKEIKLSGNGTNYHIWFLNRIKFCCFTYLYPRSDSLNLREFVEEFRK